VAGAPQFGVVMTSWNTAPKFAEGTFTFVPSKDAKKTEFMPLPGSTPAKAPTAGGKK
jgi:hypothetical protein